MEFAAAYLKTELFTHDVGKEMSWGEALFAPPTPPSPAPITRPPHTPQVPSDPPPQMLTLSAAMTPLPHLQFHKGSEIYAHIVALAVL